MAVVLRDGAERNRGGRTGPLRHLAAYRKARAAHAQPGRLNRLANDQVKAYFDRSKRPVKIMKIVQSSLAKTHLAELLDEVERGETVQITRHGKIIARLVPENADAEAARRQKAVEELRA